MQTLRTDNTPRIGPFQLLGRLGSGGMGQVYLGRGLDGRYAAVKVVHAALAGEPSFRARFAREVHTATSLRVPWTAPVLAADPDADRPWLATEYVPGPSLARLVVDAGPLPPDAVGVLAGRLTEALAVLHAAGVTHRDVKPGNVVLAADGPRLVDFGIAALEGTSALTGTGAVVGTPAFMSPEQSLGESVGPASDVFSLASVLVFAVTGVGPFGEAANPAAMLMRVSDNEPDLAEVPDRLRTELEPCLAKDPTARPSAAELAGRFAVRVSAPGARNSWPPPAVLAWVPSGVSPGPTLPLPPGQAAFLDYPTPPPAPRQPARPRARRAGVVVAAILMALLLIGGVGVAVLGRFTEPEAPGAAPPTGPGLAAAGVVRVPNGRPEALAVSPDGKRVYLPTRDGLSVIDTASDAVTVEINVPGTGDGVAVSPDGTRVYLSTLAGFVSVIDTATDQQVASIALPDGGKLAVGAGGRFGYVASDKLRAVIVVDLRTNSVTATIPVGYEPSLIAAAGDRLVVAGKGGLSVIDTARNTVIGTLPVEIAKGLAVAPDGHRAYLTTQDGPAGAVRVVDTDTASKLGDIRLGLGADTLAVSPSGRYLFVSGWGQGGGQLQVVDTTDSVVVERTDLADSIQAAVATLDGRRLWLAGLANDSLTVFDLYRYR